MLQPQSESALYHRVKEFVKMIYLIVPHGFSLGNIVELLLDIRRKVIIENIGEILRQEIVDDNSYIGGEQFAFIGSCELGFLSRFDFPIVQRQHTIFPLRSFPIALLDIFALLYGRNGWCIGRRPTDTQLFQFTNQTGLGIAGGSLRETFRCRDRRQCQHIAFRQCR